MQPGVTRAFLAEQKERAKGEAASSTAATNQQAVHPQQPSNFDDVKKT